MSQIQIKSKSLLNTAEQSYASMSELGFRMLLFIAGAIVLFLIILVKSRTASDFATSPILVVYTIFITTFQLSRVASAMMYRSTVQNRLPGAAQTEHYEPTVTFVIPCKNEEASIDMTIDQCFAADWPKEKLEVIVINDGSTDGTIHVLRRMQKKYPALVVVDWKVNRGKRHGMAEGFKRATGEIIVQLDSDSFIKPETFRELIEPFKNPRIGAVCAHADPMNADKNVLTKMQAAYYFMSFRILKAAESTFFAVFCCSGCSSAYRKDIVLPIMDEWLEERFLGKPVTWGDDRALTNWVIKLGYKTMYTDRAQAYTIVPETFRQLLTQQARWKKGWFVNSLNASKFIAKQQPFVAFTYFFPLIFLTLSTPFLATKALLFNPLFAGIAPWFYIVGIFLIACIITLYYRYVARENKYWPYIFLWSAINTIVLSFILYYALATIQNRKWGTR
jgi:hyaluronan synthase